MNINFNKILNENDFYHTNNYKIIMCYGKTPYTPGRYLEDSLRNMGIYINLYEDEINFNEVDISEYQAVLFIESPAKPPIKVKNIKKVTIPKLFWIHHGWNRLNINKKLEKRYKPDLILMAHSLDLSKEFSAPISFFPFAMDDTIFDSKKPLKNRKFDIAFVGNKSQNNYSKRNYILTEIQKEFKNHNLSLFSNIYLKDLANLYGDSKIVFNYTGKFNCINMRLFEGIGCGSLVISDTASYQNRILQDKKHYVSFKKVSDLTQKIYYYLNNIDKAQCIATSGYNYLKSHHTYKDRANQIIALINDLRK